MSHGWNYGQTDRRRISNSILDVSKDLFRHVLRHEIKAQVNAEPSLQNESSKLLWFGDRPNQQAHLCDVDYSHLMHSFR